MQGVVTPNCWQWWFAWLFLGFVMWATVLRLFGCLARLDGPLVTNSLFSQTCLITISLVRCLSRRFLLAWRGRRRLTHLYLWGGLADPDVQRDLLHNGSTHSRGECQYSGPGKNGEGRKELNAYHPSKPLVVVLSLIRRSDDDLLRQGDTTTSID
jgi:hypothetical protein